MSGWDFEQGEPDRTAVRSFESMQGQPGAGQPGAGHPGGGGYGQPPFGGGPDGFGGPPVDERRGRPLLWLILGLLVIGAGVAGTLFWLDRNGSTNNADEAAYVTTDDGEIATDAPTDEADGDDDGDGGPDDDGTTGAQFAPTSTPVPPTPAPSVAPTPTVTPAPIIDCIGDVPCCVIGPYLPITEDTVGIAFESLVEPTEAFGVRYLEAGPVGGFEFNDEDWFDFERLGETGLDRFLVAPRSSLSGLGCDFGTDGESTSPAVGADGELPILIVDGIGDLSFGTSTVADARALFDPLFGNATVETLGECPSGADQAASWDALQLVFQSGRLAGWFYDGRFEGEPRLVTPSGVAIGTSESEVERIYAGVTIEETSIGREFWFEVPSGVMSGLISDGRVTSLWAGGVCIFR